MTLFMKKTDEVLLEKIVDKAKKATVFYSLDRGVKTIQGEEMPVIDGLLPSADVVEEFNKGNISLKKAVNKLKKRIKKVGDNITSSAEIYMFISQILNSKKMAVIILPDLEKKSYKFVIAYFKMLFELFDLEILDAENKKDRKDFKDVLKGKKKKITKNIKELVASAIAVTKDGSKFLNKLYKKVRPVIASAKLDMYDEIVSNKRSLKKFHEEVKDVLKATVDNDGFKYMKEINDIFGMQTNKKKFKNLKGLEKSELVCILRHVGTRLCGVDVGSTEYHKNMKPVLVSLGYDLNDFKTSIDSYKKEQKEQAAKPKLLGA